ncbi:hypothetical protein HAX54_024940, partial [Datura stramonium]|nr:hypothetical protein [Datura stramonium]
MAACQFQPQPTRENGTSKPIGQSSYRPKFRSIPNFQSKLSLPFSLEVLTCISPFSSAAKSGT